MATEKATIIEKIYSKNRHGVRRQNNQTNDRKQKTTEKIITTWNSEPMLTETTKKEKPNSKPEMIWNFYCKAAEKATINEKI